ncbi:MAG: nucleoside phosphorylase [Deltaproteobacteria bacterium]|nr:nucleoside phosphorylase [Deltaproteobacteria bacterium]
MPGPPVPQEGPFSKIQIKGCQQIPLFSNMIIPFEVTLQRFLEIPLQHLALHREKNLVLEPSSTEKKADMPVEQGIIIPKKTKQDPSVGPESLMILIPSEVHYLVARTSAQKVPISDISMSRIFLIKQAHSHPVSLCGPFLGAPQAVMAMEKLVVLGAKRIWMLGWCGSLNPDLRIGDLVLPTWAVSEEGTSQHYPISQSPPRPSKELNRSLERALEKRGIIPFKGPVWTTDAPYRETETKVKIHQDRGIVAVDMELSALMTVALFRSVQFAAALIVSDELFDYVWRPGFGDPVLEQRTRVASQVLLELTMDAESRSKV